MVDREVSENLSLILYHVIYFYLSKFKTKFFKPKIDKFVKSPFTLIFIIPGLARQSA